MKNIRSAYVFYLKLLKEFYLVFGIYYKNSFHSGNIYRCREIITKKKFDTFYLVFNSYASKLIK